jgi:protein-L-isoaspartate(D-aspartate) O-methyltransferase
MSATNLERVRADFAEDIRVQGNIKTIALVTGLARVPREDFLGPGPWRIVRAADTAKGYQSTPDADPRHLCDNVLVALDESRRLNNGEPLSLLIFLDTLELSPGERLLHIGCGVGYYTAIAAHAVGMTGSVVAVEIDKSLGTRAAGNLEAYRNVEVTVGDGSRREPGAFDAIFVNAGCTGPLPIWLDQLAVGGRLLVPLTVDLPPYPGIGAGRMLLVTRRDGGYDARLVSPVGIFHCEGARTDDGNVRLAKAMAQGDLQSIRRLRRDPHEQGPNCWLHGETFCLEADPALRTPARTSVSVDPASIGNYVGRYQLTADLFIAITRERDALFAQANGQRKIAIYAESEQKFFYQDVDAQITFVATTGQAASALILHQGGRDIPAKRVDRT